MDPNQSPQLGSAGEPGSHLQFQISLLRLMDQKWTDQKWTENSMDQKTESKVGSSVQGPSLQVPSRPVIELERLQHCGPANERLKTQS
jgi:hypothetical protein